MLVHQKEGYANSTNKDSTVRPSVSAAGQSFTNADDLPTDPLMPDLEDTDIFSCAYDDEDLHQKAEENKSQRLLKLLICLFSLINRTQEGKRAIRTKWVYRNKKDKRGIVVRNKARLVAQGYTQEKGIDYDKVFALVAKIEATSQDKYVADILKKFDFVTVKTTSTPIETNKALLKDEEAEDVDLHLYRSMIGSLIYLTASRPDIMFAVCACARDLPFDLEAFSDSDYAGASLDRKSITGAEYVAAANRCRQVLWIQNQMLDYGFNFMNTKIYIDNE
ncbi:putative ribonuclease H-like domain-containing protein, partial [Tanacetum coccineum]